MQIVLVDTCSVRSSRNRHNFSLQEVIVSTSTVRGINEDPKLGKIVSDILTFNGTDYSSSLKVDLIFKGSVTGGITLWKFELQLQCTSGDCSNVLKILRDKFDEDVKISVHLRSIPTVVENGNGEYMGRDTIVSATGMTIDPENFTCSGSTTRLNPTQFERLGNSNGPGSNLRMTIIAHIPNIIASVSEDATPEISISQRILEDAIASDVVITAGNGVEIVAHKCFLSAISPVLRTMFQSGLEEYRSGQVDMRDMSEEGVNAFLRYIYFGDLTAPQENVEDSFELLYAAHKYHVPRLESLMVTYLMERSDNDFWEELALRIYTFSRSIDSMEELKTKAVRLLKSKLDALEVLPEYKELFQKSPDAAMELCRNLAMVSLQ